MGNTFQPGNEEFDDVTGHSVKAHVTSTEGDDTEGHSFRRSLAEDDVEGHGRKGPGLAETEDVEAHSVRGRPLTKKEDDA